MVVRQKFSVKGSVKKVRLVNFMTYVDEVFWPGPGFNVMVGPNGSGKSSVVTALCVGLGGDVEPAEYVRDVSAVISSEDTEVTMIICHSKCGHEVGEYISV